MTSQERKTPEDEQTQGCFTIPEDFDPSETFNELTPHDSEDDSKVSDTAELEDIDEKVESDEEVEKAEGDEETDEDTDEDTDENTDECTLSYKTRLMMFVETLTFHNNEEDREAHLLANFFFPGSVDMKDKTTTYKEKILKRYEEKSEEECKMLFKIFKKMMDPVNGEEVFEDFFKNVLTPACEDAIRKMITDKEDTEECKRLLEKIEKFIDPVHGRKAVNDDFIKKQVYADTK